ncbi:hypothetical protein [Commensalibacter oyaizuii]|uniref:Glycosyltransferase n=1 Tax=Commensalibacter oyaizuii TaxID=3043873 RepID=A0ABT6PYE8_9PROT|nr:hypothetical protein [Commensalibacter sp. TBRC 16381]MDI2089885.1 hypothetical protein [Commensalibacter sp. TBRC 16381]
MVLPFDNDDRYKNFIIRVWTGGNPGNIMMMYMSALKLQRKLGFGSLAHVGIPIFSKYIPDVTLNTRQYAENSVDEYGYMPIKDRPNITYDMIGLRDYRDMNDKQYNYIPMRGLAHAAVNSHAQFINLEGYCQHIDNFPSLTDVDYETIFPCMVSNEGGKEDELVINIRGAEVLEGIHPHYCMIPPEFYEYLIQRTGKKPIFYGQLTPSPYMDELRQRFPEAQFLNSRGTIKDFDYIRKSKHIVICISTFSWLAAWLSKATTIHFPVLGVLNPLQHQSMILPFNDLRYQFYLFPECYASHVNDYRHYMDPIRTNWEFIEHDALYNRIPKWRDDVDDYIIALNHQYYRNTCQSPILKEAWQQFGEVGSYNHYMKEGFITGQKPCYVNEIYYLAKNNLALEDLRTGEFGSTYDHYIRKGQYIGLKRASDVELSDIDY